MGGQYPPIFIILMLYSVIGRDVFIHDLLKRSVRYKFFQSVVNCFFQFIVFFRYADRVILVRVSRFKDLQPLVRRNISLCGLVVDDDAVNFAGFESFDGKRAVGVLHNVLIAEILGCVYIAGSCFLNADLLAGKIVNGRDSGIGLNDNDLDAFTESLRC